MKKLILLTVFVAGSAIINYSNAQVRFNVNVGLGLPGWIGIAGGNAAADYYYIPEIDAYYNVPQRQFIYMNDGGWVFSAGLPEIYAGFDLYNCRKFPVYESRPYLNGNYYRDYYADYRGNYNRGNYNYGYRRPMMAYNNNSRMNERYGYDRDDRNNRNNNYRNDHRYEERRSEGHDRDRDNRRH